MFRKAYENEPVSIALEVIRHPWAWPGGYPAPALTDDGGLLCRDCCRSELKEIADSAPGDGWHVVDRVVLEGPAPEVPETCDHCGAGFD